MKTFAKLILSALALCAAGFAAAAYPERPITIIVPFSAGTINDVLARDVAKMLETTGKEPVIVENRTGAEGTIGGMALLNAPADGYTLMFSSNSMTVLDPLMKKILPYDPNKDMVPLCSVGRSTLLLYVSANGPYKTAADFIAAAKARPGKLTFGYASTGMRLAGELFQQLAGIQITGVPYRASTAAMTEVGSGQVDAVFIDRSSASAFYEGGKIRPLLVAGQKRLKVFPEVPTGTEAGVPGYAVQPWFGLYASGKTSSAVLAQIADLVGRATHTPEMVAVQDRRFLDSFDLCGRDMVDYRDKETQLWRGVTKKAGIEPQ